jgi:hypothetical protein
VKDAMPRPSSKKRFRSAPAVAITVAALVLTVLGAGVQQQTFSHRSTTFTAPDGAFRFSYPSDFQTCARGKLQPCNAYQMGDVCNGEALVCVLYPPEVFRRTNIAASVGFAVTEIFHNGHRPASADDCVTPYPQTEGGGSIADLPEFLVSAKHPTERIGDLIFVHGTRGGVAAGSYGATDLYRAFHNARCFELTLTVAGQDVETPAQTVLSRIQYDKNVEPTMSSILHSFRFAN